MTTLQVQLAKKYAEYKWQFDYPLASQSYFKIGGTAEVYLNVTSVDQIPELNHYFHHHSIKSTILGGASNVLISDGHIHGVILHISDQSFISESEFEFQSVAGIKTAILVRKSLDLGLTGLEKFLGVPGTLGGAVFNNAHYLNDLIGDYIEAVQVCNVSGEVYWLTQSECQFGYDFSRFQTSAETILRVRFKLKAGDSATSQKIIQESTTYRIQNQPLGLPSSGCIFQNVPNTPKLRVLFPQFADKQLIGAGFLIDQAGLKGIKEGDVEISQKHAAFIVNHGNGTMTQVQSLIRLIKNVVKEKFDVNLKEEIMYIT